MISSERHLRNGMVAGMVLLAVALSLGPFAYIIATALKPQSEILSLPPLLPSQPSLDSFRHVFGQTPFGRYLVNSFVVSAVTTILAVFLASFAAYAISRFEFRGRRVVLLGALAMSMFPQIALVSGLFLLLTRLGWIDSLQGLALPYVALTLPLAMWLLVSYFREIPRNIDRAALVDGCTRWDVLWEVILPLAAPGIFSTALLVFIFAWNEFLFALTFTTHATYRTVPVGIALFEGTYHIPWGDITAASAVATAPLLVVVSCFQRYIVSGLTAGSLKG